MAVGHCSGPLRLLQRTSAVGHCRAMVKGHAIKHPLSLNFLKNFGQLQTASDCFEQAALNWINSELHLNFVDRSD